MNRPKKEGRLTLDKQGEGGVCVVCICKWCGKNQKKEEASHENRGDNTCVHCSRTRARARYVCVRGMIVMWRSPGSLIELGDLAAARGETTLIPRWFHPQRINER
jgi:hypothetical protein